MNLILPNRMKVYLILVGLQGGVNLGLITRLAENFIVEEIRLVKPELKNEDIKKAWIFAARARKILDKKLKFFNELEEAVKDMDIVFATSAVSADTGANIRRRAVTPEEAVRISIKGGYNNIGLVFGRESTGLTNEELDKCDSLITIEANPIYRTLNIAMSVAIVLYVFFTKRETEKKPKFASRELRSRTINYFYDISIITTENTDYAERATKAFSNILNRGMPDYKEIKLLMGILRKNFLILKKYKEEHI